jgi:fimbrial isopeptide formation D2 family protein/LPXTG-motif cell wall-anchored protein
MKKTFKKLFAALLAAALVLAMAVPAFAATNTGTNGSITISNTVKDETYTIYRMFKLDSYNAESNTYSYTVESDWEGFFKTGAGGNYITLDGQNHPTWTAADENDSTTVAAFAKAALAWAADKKISGTKETATGDTVTFSNLDLGYYLVDSSLGALCGLNTTNPDATIKEKNEKPEIKKEVQTSAGDWSSENNAKIGDTVEYKVEIKVADGAQKYTVTDTMSKGLTFNNSSLKVTANDAVTTDYTLTSTTNGFTLVLPETYVSTLTKGTTIIVTYNATLNKDAVIDGDGNANEVKLSYGNHQNTVPSKVTTKSYQFDLVKVDGTTNKLLDGAEFELADGETKLSFVKDTAGNYRVATTGDEGATTTITVKNGKVNIYGLAGKTYTLTETKAPDGYNKLVTSETVNLADGSKTHATIVDSVYKDGGVVVENHAGTVLPSTGGMGTTVLYLAGAAIIAAAGYGLYRRHRSRKQDA